MADQKQSTLLGDEVKKSAQPKSESTYPPNKNHRAIFGLLGTEMADDEMSRAWARMFDGGHDFGPALGDKMMDQGIEWQYFAYGKAARIVSPDNINSTVIFSNENGYVGEESGI